MKCTNVCRLHSSDKRHMESANYFIPVQIIMQLSLEICMLSSIGKDLMLLGFLCFVRG